MKKWVMTPARAAYYKSKRKKGSLSTLTRTKIFKRDSTKASDAAKWVDAALKWGG